MKKQVISCVIFLMFLVCFCGIASAESSIPLNTNSITCTITGPEEAHVGDECTISYEISGGSGEYTDMTISIGPTFDFDGHHGLGSDEYHFENSTGTFTFVCPAGSEARVAIDVTDAVTGENCWVNHYISLEQNPNFPVKLSFDKEQYYMGDNISVNYTIEGLTTSLVNSRVFWGVINRYYTVNIPIGIQEITSGNATIIYQPLYGEYVKLFLQAEDENGNIIYGESEMIQMEAITVDMSQALPGSLTRIEEEAFYGTAFLVIEIPVSVTYIDEHAFDGSNIRLIVGHSEYVREYATRHNTSYVER